MAAGRSEPTEFEFQLLGPVTVVAAGRERALSGTKQRTLLAALLLARGALVLDSQLIGVLWGDQAPATVGAQLYTHASRIRGRLGAGLGLVRQSTGYRLRPVEHRCDAVEFARLAAEGHDALRAGRYAAAATRLRDALGWWRGPALADVTDLLRDAEVAALDEARMAALEGRIEAELALGEHLRLVPELSGLVRREPLRERLRVLLMTAFYRSGRRAAALECFAEGRRTLGEELGVDPGEALLAAQRAVLRGDQLRPGARLAGAGVGP
ncbi:regulator protein [Actinoplanes sp. ATCC 53533]|uniref:AfsR/SARP family transcriptional regulator n=1 Tax=Actinoplanes sp. ATCC 53533 TaxID=1288362 RepID=UPI000F76E505|nr:AfsR/SARP family transcriptional regulator [Actinoplanes sp. ATCC 53533]RSM59781.1 regulator protein [Actinoplanes sp. ATCC 53533]